MKKGYRQFKVRLFYGWNGKYYTYLNGKYFEKNLVAEEIGCENE